MIIGILTGGGDAPGLNGVIRAVVKTAHIQYGWEVMGIFDGFEGLIGKTNAKKLTPWSTRGILYRGGTILGATNRGNPFASKVMIKGKEVERDLSDSVIGNMKKLGIDALVVIGGDGSLNIAYKLQLKGAKVIGVPKTIDNDLRATHITFGFSTAVETAQMPSISSKPPLKATTGLWYWNLWEDMQDGLRWRQGSREGRTSSLSLKSPTILKKSRRSSSKEKKQAAIRASLLWLKGPSRSAARWLCSKKMLQAMP